MLPAVRLPLLLLALAAGGAAPAQSFPAMARIKTGTASVRGTAGEFSPETGKLDRGTQVTVTAAEGNDWLAIQPPAGSISWISWALVEPQGKADADGRFVPPFNAVVTPDDGAAVRAGAVGEGRPLAVQRTKLPKGTIVQVVGAKVKVKQDGEELETSWYPIMAPKDDVRYVRRDAVEWAGTAPGPGFVVKTGGSTSKPLPGAPAAPDPSAASKGDFTLSIPNERQPFGPGNPHATKPADWPNNYPLWKDAEKARAAGDTKTARELYAKLAAEVGREGPGQDVELANLCYDRIYNSLGTPAPKADDGLNWRPKEGTPPAVKADPPRAAGKTASGTLRDSKVMLDGKWRIYFLTDDSSVLRHYVISDGVDLDRHLGKRVEVTGREIKAESLRGEPVFVATDVKTK